MDEHRTFWIVLCVLLGIGVTVLAIMLSTNHGRAQALQPMVVAMPCGDSDAIGDEVHKLGERIVWRGLDGENALVYVTQSKSGGWTIFRQVPGDNRVCVLSAGEHAAPVVPDYAELDLRS